MNEILTESLDAKRAHFLKTAESIKEQGYRLHRQEHDADGRDPKIYHISEHPLTVDKRAKEMAEILGLSPEQCAVVEMAIAWHDTVIEYDNSDPNNLLAMIRRHRRAREEDVSTGLKGNEKESARLLAEEMRKANKQAGEEIFTEEHIETAVWAIHATYPADNRDAIFKEYFYYQCATEQNPVLGELLCNLAEQGVTQGHLFFQPHLEKPLEEGHTVPREVLLVALADFGAAGCAFKEEFFKEGDDEMRELYGNLRKPEIFSRLANGEEKKDKEDREKVLNAFFLWLESQIGFAAWQALRFEKIIYLLKQQHGINEDEEQGFRTLFCHYKKNILAVRDRARDLKIAVKREKNTHGEKTAFCFLAKNMGYDIIQTSI